MRATQRERERGRERGRERKKDVKNNEGERDTEPARGLCRGAPLQPGVSTPVATRARADAVLVLAMLSFMRLISSQCSEDKLLDFGPRAVVLGIEIDCSESGEGLLLISKKKGRAEAVCDALEKFPCLWQVVS